MREKTMTTIPEGGRCRGIGLCVLPWLTLLVLALAALPLSAVTLLAPNGGESWAIGQTVTVSWTPTAVGSEVRLILYRGGTTEAHKVGNIKNSAAGDRGSFSWVAGNYVGGTAVAGSDYYVRVQRIDSEEADVSDAPFSLQGGIEVTSPMETAAYEASTSTMSVEWSVTGLAGNVRIDLERQDGPERYVIRDAVAAGGSPVAWPVPLATAEGTYRVRVSQGGVEGTSGRCHIMAFRPPYLRVLQPNGGEELVMGRSYPVRWQPHGLSGNVRVELLKGGRLVGTLSESTPVGGICTYYWDGKTCGTVKLLARNDYKIQVSTLDGAYSDASDAPFTLTLPPNIILYDPHEGDTWVSGTVEEIRWNATKLEGYLVTIDLSFPDPDRVTGFGGFLIARDVPGTDKHFAWTVGTVRNAGSVAFHRGRKTGCTIRLRAVKGTSVLLSESKPFTIETR